MASLDLAWAIMPLRITAKQVKPMLTVDFTSRESNIRAAAAAGCDPTRFTTTDEIHPTLRRARVNQA
jgi:hypothetical protein